MAITVYGGLKKWLLSEVLQYISYRVCIYVLSMLSSCTFDIYKHE